MRVSERTHYGLRAMTELAKAYGAGPLPLSEIARVEHLPLPYLEQLIGDLRRANLVQGTRGIRGGYSLTRPPGQITVGHVVRALEGPIVLVECTSETYEPGSCVREAECLSRSVWHMVKTSIEQVLDATTLEHMCQQNVGQRTFVPLVDLLPRGMPVAESSMKVSC